MQAVILAAGKGERLLPLTQDIPKSMVIVGRNNVFEWCLQPLWESGIFDSYVVCTGYKEERLIDCIKEGVHYGMLPSNIKFSTGGPRGVNGDLLAARDLLEDEFVLVNGDTYVEVDYEEMIEWAGGSDAFVTNAISKDGIYNRAVDWFLNVSDEIYDDVPKFNFTDAGVYYVRKDVLHNIPPNSDSLDFGPAAINGYVVGRFYDLGTFEGIETFKREKRLE